MIRIKENRIADHVDLLKQYSHGLISLDATMKKALGEIKKDKGLYQHSKNVAVISSAIGAAYNFNLEELMGIYTGALLHDTGKIYIPKEILDKEGPLTAKEKQKMSEHPALGYEALKKSKFISDIALDIILGHHEKLNGNGYPDKRRKKNIPIYTQIVTVADMFDAMTSDRCYRGALDEVIVQKILFQDKGINPVIVKVLSNLITVETEDPIEYIFLRDNAQIAT